MIKENMSMEQFRDWVRHAINKEIEALIEEEIEKIQERVAKRKDEITTGVVLYAERQIKMETHGDELRILIKKEE